MLRWRPAVIARGVIARAARGRAYAVWPDVQRPQVIVDVGHAPAAAWLHATFERSARAGGFLHPATREALRARGLLIGPPSRIALTAAERGLGGPIRKPRLAIYSSTGETYLKAMCFIFEEDRPAPEVAVKMMPDRRFATRMRAESAFVEAIRKRLAGATQLTAALPLPPLYSGDALGDYVVVQRPDPLASATGHCDRSKAFAWLRDFHAATTVGTPAWGPADDRAELEHVRYAWNRLRPDREAAVTSRVAELLASQRGQSVPRCTIHGDFWHGNLACEAEKFRVYDWEWAEAEGRPFFDLWMYELGELRERAQRGEQNLTRATLDSLERVRRELEMGGVDARFALATLAPAVGQITFRERRATGLPGGAEATSVHVMAAVEELLLSDRSDYRSR